MDNVVPASGSLSLASREVHRFAVVASSLTAAASPCAVGASFRSLTPIAKTWSTLSPSGSVARTVTLKRTKLQKPA